MGVSALVLLAIGTLSIAGYQEAQRRLISAARHAVFETIWHRDRGAGADTDRIFRSHFDDDGYVRPIPEEPWILEGDVRTVASRHSAPGHASVASTALLRPLQIVGGFLGDGFDLTGSGFVTAETSVQLPRSHRLPAPFRDLQLSFAQPMAILSDAWNASDSDHVLRRTSGLVPTHRLSAMSTLWRTLATPLAVVEPGLDRLCLGLIEPETLPEDRLQGPRRSGAPDPCR